jgi:hypothetical protein
MTPAGSYPIGMYRLRRRAGLAVLAWMLLGIAVGAGSAFAAGGCCEMPGEHAGSDREAPCHSVAPTSCCEASAVGHAPGLPGAPALACVAAPLAGADRPLSGALLGPAPISAARIALAAIVLRL